MSQWMPYVAMAFAIASVAIASVGFNVYTTRAVQRRRQFDHDAIQLEADKQADNDL